MLRTVAGIVAGVVVVGVVVFGLQQVSAMLHPLPAGLDPMDPDQQEAFLAHLAGMPVAAWAVAFGSEVLGALLGGLAAGTIAHERSKVAAGVIVGLAVVGSIMNWTSFPHPMWFIVGQLVLYPLAFLLLTRLLGRTAPQGDPA